MKKISCFLTIIATILCFGCSLKISSYYYLLLENDSKGCSIMVDDYFNFSSDEVVWYERGSIVLSETCEKDKVYDNYYMLDDVGPTSNRKIALSLTEKGVAIYMCSTAGIEFVNTFVTKAWLSNKLNNSTEYSVSFYEHDSIAHSHIVLSSKTINDLK